MAKDVWETILDAAREGKSVQVTLPPGARVHRPKRPSGGRPRVRGAARWSGYAAYDPDTEGRPRCLHPGCGKYLRKTQALACSPEHEERVRAWHAKIAERMKEADNG